MLGYFSLIGLLRVHTLIGDYHSGLKALYPLNINDRTNLFAPKIAGCNIALYYYGGFCYMMMRRCVCCWELVRWRREEERERRRGGLIIGGEQQGGLGLHCFGGFC